MPLKDMTWRFLQKNILHQIFAADIWTGHIQGSNWKMLENVRIFFLPEIGERLKKYENGKIFDPDIAEWMGFTYRQLQLETGVKSKELVNRITFNDMLRLYPGMHTIDELDAAERISEMYNLVNN